MYYICDFPQKGIKTKIPLYKNNKIDIRKNANKAFDILSDKMNFDNNDDGQKYLRFWISDENNNIYPFIGTRIKYEKPVNSKNNNGNEIIVKYRNIVVPYDNNFNSMFYQDGGKHNK